MKNLLIYFMTFLAILLPSVWYLVLSDRDSAPKKNSTDPAKPVDPPVFRFTADAANLLVALGIGKLFRMMFPASCRELQKKLNYADLRELTPERIYCTQIVLVVFLAAAAAGVTSLVVEPDQQLGIPIAALIAAFVAWFLPGITVGNLVDERKTKILQALPFSIDLISSAMRGGLDFTAAIRFYVKLGIKNPLTDEYAAMLREMELGLLRTAALQNMADRIEIKEFTSFAEAIVMGTELGASLTETMEIQAEEMRKLRFSIAECKAQRAPSLMLIPMALFILPAVFIIILTPVFLKMQAAGVPLF